MSAPRCGPAVLAAAAGIAVIALGSRAAAAGCGDEIDLLAQQYALSTDLSQAAQPGPVGSAPIDAGKRRQMQVLLNGARSAYQQGKEAECFQRVAEARAIPEPG